MMLPIEDGNDARRAGVPLRESDAEPVNLEAELVPHARAAENTNGHGHGPNGHARDDVPPPSDADAPPPAAANAAQPERLVVIYRESDLHAVNDAIIGALVPDPDIYQRANRIVRVLRDTSPASPGLSIDLVGDGELTDRITRHVALSKLTKKGTQPVTPGRAIVRGIQERGEYPFRHLSGIVRAPVLLMDGRVLQTPGYDAGSGIFYDPIRVYPPVTDAPSRDDARLAVAELLDVAIDSPFAKPEHRSAWVAFVLTLVARTAIDGCIPAFGFDAPTRGSGKTFLLEAGAIIAHGSRPALQAFPLEDAEQRKLLTAAVIEGARLIAFDNLTGAFSGGPINLAVTSSRWSDRILGVSERVAAPFGAVIAATANNLTVGPDMDRRVQHCRIESDAEHPELRERWTHPDPYRWLVAEHPRLLCAALTLLRAFHRAGKPAPAGGLRAWGSFEAWSELVRGAIAWVGEADPLDARAALVEDSAPTDDAARRIVHGWAAFKGGVTAGEALKQIYPHVRASDRWATEADRDPHPALREALEELCRGRPDVRSVGQRLRRFRGRWFDDLRLVVGCKSNGSRKWSVERRGAADADDSDLGSKTKS